MGLLLTDLRADFATTRLMTLDAAAIPDIIAAFTRLDAQAEGWLATEHVAPEARRITRTVDMRYAGQNYELAVPLPAGPVTTATIDGLAQGFAQAHERMYGFVAEGEPVQLVTFRAEATGLVRKAAFRPQADAGPDASGAIIGKRDVWLPEAGGFVPCPVYDRDRLQAGNRIAGPAIVEQMDATTVILPGMTGTVEPYMNLILEAQR
jgi:N-methylhydantoinase A